MTSLGPTWAAATGWDTVEDWVQALLRARWGAEGDDYDHEGLCAELREAVNDNLPEGWNLEDSRFVVPKPTPGDALDTIRAVIDEVDFWGIAALYDNGD